MIEYCLGFAFDENLDQVVLIEKQRPFWQQGLLNGVGGKIELRENPYFAMEREFQEETGVLHQAWKKFGYLYGEDWGVYLFTTKLSDRQIKNVNGFINVLDYATTEEVFVKTVDNLSGTIPNLMWLVPMAKYTLQTSAHLADIDTKEFFQINEISLY